MNLIEINAPSTFLRLWARNPDVRNTKIFESGDGLGVLVSEDNTPKWGWLKHLSISRHDRYPTWEEILEVKEKIFGDIDVMMIMPKKSDYVNVHQNCFHLWQTPQEWGLQ